MLNVSKSSNCYKTKAISDVLTIKKVLLPVSGRGTRASGKEGDMKRRREKRERER